PVVHSGGVYACTEGPRFETPAEIEMIRRFGGHLIGSSAVPEICLARELGLCYALLTVVSNRAAGYQDRVDSRDVLEAVWSVRDKLSNYLPDALLAAAGSSRAAPCTDNEHESERLRSRLLRRAERR
ncbi:MAG: S-methyl-5'-thioadenosine phosphorylase, partial [Actinomycetia bacterium]|nr:S-methyl-5'-thioadenosine phosphorylase [Actinomycetes bacterium]